jgi:hypothetical protein
MCRQVSTPLWAVVLFVFNPIELASCEGPVADKGYLDDEWRRAGARASRSTAPAVGQQAPGLTHACVRACDCVPGPVTAPKVLCEVNECMPRSICRADAPLLRESRRVHTGAAVLIAPKHGKHNRRAASDDERASTDGATQPPGTSHMVGIGAAVVLAFYI